MIPRKWNKMNQIYTLPSSQTLYFIIFRALWIDNSEYKTTGKVYWYNRTTWFESVERLNNCKRGLSDPNKFSVYYGVCKGKGRDVLCLSDIKKYTSRREITSVVCNKRPASICLQGDALGCRSKLLFKRGDSENIRDNGDVQIKPISFPFDGGRGLEVGNSRYTWAYRGIYWIC